MLPIVLHKPEQWNEKTEEFIPGKDINIQLEHSLVSLRKWEAKYHKPFLSREAKTFEETLDYIKFMTITQNVPDEMYLYLSEDNIKKINEYMEDPMTATWFNTHDEKGKMNGEQVTAELIYWWMIALNIPDKFEKWHLNQLMTLIKVCNIKNQPAKKMNTREVMSRNAALNEARRKRLNSKG